MFQNKISQKTLLLLSAMIVLLYVAPYVYLGENSYIQVHDNLDSQVINKILVAEEGANPKIDRVMNGLPRACLPSELNAVIALFLLFKPFTAYLINEVIVHLIAFFGMFLLLRNHFIKNDDNILISLGVSLCFAYLPFYSIYGLSIAGQPLLLNAFLNLLKQKKRRVFDFVIIFLFPFYSLLSATGVFIIFVLALFFLWYSFKNKKINVPFLLGICILVVMYTVVEYRLIHLTFFEDSFISHRSVRNPEFKTFGFTASIVNGLRNFLVGQHHAVSLHTLILIFSGACLIYVFVLKKDFRNRDLKILLFFLGLSLIISIISDLYYWKGLIPAKEQIPLLNSFQWRFYFLHPLLWYVIFALSLLLLSPLRFRKVNLGKLFTIVIVAIQLFYLLSRNQELKVNVKKVLQFPVTQERLSFKEFYSPRLFKEISNFISTPQEEYRVVNIGIHPSVTQYNGFYTLDSYLNIYPLAYKNRFRKIIEKELAKSKKWSEYFDFWGNRCYLLISDLEQKRFEITKEKSVPIKVDLNTKALKSMGGKYIISAVKIVNESENNITLSKIFLSPDSPWKVYLYRVD